MDDNAIIGHFNYVHVDSFEMAGKLGHFNVIKGNFNFIIEVGAWIGNQNKITGVNRFVKQIAFKLKPAASLITHHVIDVSDDVTIGERSCIAGYGTQIWSHSFLFGTSKAALITKPVEIGANCYIGSNSVILPGVTIADHVMVGAHTTVSKSLANPGLYVGSTVRYIPYDVDQTIAELQHSDSVYLFDR